MGYVEEGGGVGYLEEGGGVGYVGGGGRRGGVHRRRREVACGTLVEEGGVVGYVGGGVRWVGEGGGWVRISVQAATFLSPYLFGLLVARWNECLVLPSGEPRH